jgi:hypothetical protein
MGGFKDSLNPNFRNLFQDAAVSLQFCPGRCHSLPGWVIPREKSQKCRDMATMVHDDRDVFLQP